MTKPARPDAADLVLAVDVGTSQARACAYTPGGQVVARTSHDHTTLFPAPERAEIAAEELVGSMTAAVAGLGPHLDRVRAVAVAAELGTVFLDRDGVPLGPAICWLDKRARRQAATIEDAFGAEAVYATAGRTVDPELPAAKLLWLRDHDPDRAAMVRRLASIKDFLVHGLTGVVVTDPTHASYSMFYDVGRRSWNVALMDELDVAAELLPEVMPATSVAGVVTPEAARRTGLHPGTPVVVGGPDGTVGTVGAGLVRPGLTVDLAGTADVVFHSLAGPVHDPRRDAVLNAHLVHGLWALGGPTGTTGGAVARYAELLGYGSDADGLAALDRDAATVPPGAAGLACLTSMAGDRFPGWQPDARGVLFGLRMSHQRAHVARALLEGTAYTLRSALDVYRRLGLSVDEVRLVGGGARSAVGTRIRADACGIAVRPALVSEATALGAAMLALVATGHMPDLAAAGDALVDTASAVAPNPDAAHAYERLYAGYARLRTDLLTAFHHWADDAERT